MIDLEQDNDEIFSLDAAMARLERGYPVAVTARIYHPAPGVTCVRWNIPPEPRYVVDKTYQTD